MRPRHFAAVALLAATCACTSGRQLTREDVRSEVISAASGLWPSIPHGTRNDHLLYAYFAVGIFSALLMEYEVHFYSSGPIEEDWTVKDLSENFMVASLGSLLGAVLTTTLLMLGVLVLLPRPLSSRASPRLKIGVQDAESC